MNILIKIIMSGQKVIILKQVVDQRDDLLLLLQRRVINHKLNIKN